MRTHIKLPVSSLDDGRIIDADGYTVCVACAPGGADLEWTKQDKVRKELARQMADLMNGVKK